MPKNIGGISDIKTSQKGRVRSMPKQKGSAYLELYLMTKEKERLEKYGSCVGKSKEHAEASLKQVEKALEKLMGEVGRDEKRVLKKPLSVTESNAGFKKIPIGY